MMILAFIHAEWKKIIFPLERVMSAISKRVKHISERERVSHGHRCRLRGDAYKSGAFMNGYGSTHFYKHPSSDQPSFKLYFNFPLQNHY